jgi:hypothetical protein
VSGLTFQEWTPDVDTSRPPVAMLINSSELRAAGFKLKKVLPPARKKKNSRGGVGETPRMMRMKILFRPLLDHHDREISLQDDDLLVCILGAE